MHSAEANNYGDKLSESSRTKFLLIMTLTRTSRSYGNTDMYMYGNT